MSFLPTHHPVKYGTPMATSGLIELGRELGTLGFSLVL